ncbi:penicillin-binding protein [Clostridia bacterium]|nr:penicillin-binding protein [Clostridia bacterium]
MGWLRHRDNQIIALIVILMIALFIRLFVLTVVQNEDWILAADNNDMRTVYTAAPRGEIYDRYGRLLAANLPSFTVQFSRNNMNDDALNKSAAMIINILEGNGESYVDNFPILYEDGRFVYKYQKEIVAWLISQEMPPEYSAEQAFDEIRRRNNISDELDQYDAQSELQSIGVNPPISVRSMIYSKDLEKNNFLTRYKLDKTISAAEAFSAIREKYKLPKSLTVTEARKIMVLRNELSVLGYMQYIPANIASNVSNKTVLEIEERSSELRGISVSTESIRYYPNGNSASHVLGYMGRISETQKEYYVNEKGYRPSDMIGLEGIERDKESILKGADGYMEVQVNSRGEKVRVISEKPAVKGKDIYLTIDLKFQKECEGILAKGLGELQRGGTFESKWGDYKFKDPEPNANVGAIVVLDIKNDSEPLAIVNNPDFDPNQFSTGISYDAWDALQSQNPRDLLSPLPLYNVAARTAVQPGSTFKMITALAALESGLNPNQRLHDGGHVKVGDREFNCLLYTTNGGSHGNVDLYHALEVSCNYYFYDIATGMDYYSGKSLPFKDNISIEKITSYAEQFGLGQNTGIELTETAAGVPTAEKKLSTQRALLKRHLLDNAEEYFTDEVLADKTLMMQQIDEIIGWTEENPSRSEIITRLNGMGIKAELVSTVADYCKFTIFNYAQWTTGDELNISIGQGDNAYTPIQMANYIATLGNGGIRNNVSLIRAIEGEGKVEKKPGYKVQLSNYEYINDVIKGMNRVVNGSGGSLRSAFSGFPVSVAAKTGTAQKSGFIQPPDEVEYIKTHLKGIDSNLSWDDVETEMNRLLVTYPNIYTSKNRAVRKAVTSLSNFSTRTIEDRIDMYKDSYKPYAWVVALAPADDPHIAVAVLMFQGNTSLNAAPVAKEVIAKYFELEKEYKDFNLESTFN